MDDPQSRTRTAVTCLTRSGSIIDPDPYQCSQRPAIMQRTPLLSHRQSPCQPVIGCRRSRGNVRNGWKAGILRTSRIAQGRPSRPTKWTSNERLKSAFKRCSRDSPFGRRNDGPPVLWSGGPFLGSQFTRGAPAKDQCRGYFQNSSASAELGITRTLCVRTGSSGNRIMGQRRQ